MRRNPTPSITAKMYRDFAATTVAITALIALFAGGEKDNAAAAQANPTMQAAPKAENAKARQQAEPAREDPGTWGSDVDFGRPTTQAAYDGGSWTPDVGPWQPDLPAPTAARDGTPTLTAAERDELARATARTAATQPTEDSQG